MPVVSLGAVSPAPEDRRRLAGDESEEDELLSLVDAPPQRQRTEPTSHRVLRARRVGLGAAALSLAAVGLRAGSSALSAESPPPPAPLRQASEHLWVKRVANTGCSNWKDISLGATSTEPNVYSCGLRCKNAKKCVGFGYQANGCSDSSKGREQPGACSLWSGECDMEDNDCQADYTMEKKEKPDWTLRSWGMHCSNAMEIKLGQYTVESSASACGAKCLDHEECLGFGYHTGTCDKKTDSLPGACFLWKGECETTPSVCFDDYVMARSPDAHSTTHHVALKDLFNSSTSMKLSPTTTSSTSTTTRTTLQKLAMAPFKLEHVDLSKLAKNKTLEKAVLDTLRQDIAEDNGVEPDDVQVQLV